MGKLQRGEKLKPRGGRSTPRGLPIVCLAPLSFGLLLQVGCSGLNPVTGNDPLVGGPPIPPAAATKAVAAIPPPPSPTTVPPPPVAANSILSNAALASAAPRTLDSSSPDLRISSPASNAGNESWARQGPAGGMGQLAGGGGAILRPPEPVAEPAPRRELTPVSNPGSSPDPAAARTTPPPGNGNSFEQLQAQMVTRGVLWQRLEMVGETGGWKYSCSVPNRQNPKLRRTYEARANDPAAAIRAVLEQLDKEP